MDTQITNRVLTDVFSFKVTQIKVIEIAFQTYFNSKEFCLRNGMLLSTHYSINRPNWEMEFLIVVKAEILQLQLVDRTHQISMPKSTAAAIKNMYDQVIDEDYITNIRLVADCIQNIQTLLECDAFFNLKLFESIYYLKSDSPVCYARLKKHVKIDWNEYE